MLAMFVEMALYGVGAAVIIYLVYTLFLSGGGKSAKAGPKKHRRFERREGERGDRRKSDQGPPPGVEDRRKDPRRGRD
ncbi:MAG: hypothetical protein JWQ90_4836 [Hydrocarboniphaga sp.]|uniref:hypothetical protein n=1 Tax=Hydrocarboniphaga sp. TaxID=2033016 RepID=UPI002601F2D6|nr:hypothetical protein [Hydrocarboniphaga sp.]MDB5972386.1 hypothetical protein [Hydrocarboniphaga sp.]